MSKQYIESDFLTGIESILAARLSLSAWLVTGSLLALVSALLVWAWLAEVDVVSPATGEVVTRAGVQLIQPKELGVIAEIHVRDGDAVSQGQLLVQLSDSLLTTELDQVAQEVMQLRLQRLRLTAMKQCLAGQVCNRELPDQDDIDPDQQDQVESLHWLQWQHYTAQVELREHRLLVAKSELSKQSQEVRNAEEMMPFYVKRDERMQAMVEGSLAAQSKVEEARENRLLQRQQLDNHKMALHKVYASVNVAERELNAYRREYEEQVHTQWFEAQSQLSVKQKEMAKLQRYIAEKRLLSPIDGVIYDSAVSTRSGVVQSGEVLMKVVPRNVALEVAIKIANKDIGFVSTGDKVKVKIDAYNFTKHGSIVGVISHISEAAVLDEQLGPVYPATVRIERSDISVNGKQAAIIPGMTAVVDIYQGKRLLAEYVLAPLMRYKDEALRER